AGRGKKTDHEGAFVWGDAQSTDFASSASNQFLIRASGGVGIGSTAPEAPLHVAEGSAGSVTANGNSIAAFEKSGTSYLSLLTPSANESGVLFGNPSHNSDGGVIFKNTSTPGGLQFRTRQNDTKMVIQTNGNVGIGTITPSRSLEV